MFKFESTGLIAYPKATIPVPEKAMAIPAAPMAVEPVFATKEQFAVASRPFSDKLGDEIVSFTVGPDHEKFTIHKNLICEKADYFKKMFNGEFVEATALAADFPEDDPQAFKLLVGWIYTGDIEVLGSNQIQDAIKLNGLAEKFAMADLADDTMAHLIGFLKMNGYLCAPSQIGHGYQVTHSNSKLRLFLARTYVYMTLHFSDDYCDGVWNLAQMQEIIKEHDDLFADTFAMMRLQAGKLRVDPRYEHPCDYHQHAKDEPCPHIKK